MGMCLLISIFIVLTTEDLVIIKERKAGSEE